MADDGDNGEGDALLMDPFASDPKKSSNRLRAGPVWSSYISGDVSIDSGDRAELEQISKDLIWENVRNEPKVRHLSSGSPLESLKDPSYPCYLFAYGAGLPISFLGLSDTDGLNQDWLCP